MDIHAIYIPAESEWQYNMVEVNVEHSRAFLTVDSLQEVPDVIDKRIQDQIM
jgi:putative hydrolase of the HAD superfamily